MARKKWLLSLSGAVAGFVWQIRRRRIKYMLPGRVALITGASSGIGAALAQKLAARGVHVLLVARSIRRLRAVALAINTAGGMADIYPADLSDPETVALLVDQIREEQGVPDIIINNAGGGGWLYVEESSPADLEVATAVPYFAAANVTRAFLGEMRERDEGVIVNVTSPAAYMAFAGAAPYSVARWAMRAFNQALRAELFGTNVHVMLAVPGEVASTYWEHHPNARERLPAVSRFIPTLTPVAAAARIADAIEMKEAEAIFPLTLRASIFLWRIAPHMVERIIWGMGQHQREAAIAEEEDEQGGEVREET